jgi:hypothetical protein
MKKKPEEPRSFNEFAENLKNRPAPDIAYFARRGGLPPSASTYPYELSSDLFDHVRGSSANTATTRAFTQVGLYKVFCDVESFREQAAQKGVPVSDEFLRNHFRLDFMEGAIPTGSPEEAAKKADQQIAKRWPDLEKWPAKKVSRKGRPKDELRNTLRRIVAKSDQEGTDALDDLDGNGLHTPHSWQRKGCPATWTAAFAHRNWRTKVQKKLYDLRKPSA